MFPSSDWLVSKNRARNSDWEAAIGVARTSPPPKTSQQERPGPLQKPTDEQKASIRKHPRKSSLSSITKLPKITEESPPKPKLHTHKRNKSSLNPTALPFLPSPGYKRSLDNNSGGTRNELQNPPSYPLYDRSNTYMFSYGNGHGSTEGKRVNKGA